MVKTRFGKTTKGQNLEVFVAGETAYTTKSTYAAFVASLDSLVDGEIGVFLENGNLQTSTLTGGTKFFVAQKVTSTKGSPSVKKSIVYTYPTAGNLSGSVLGSAYSAPVKPVAYVGFNGTSGSLNNPTIAADQDYQINLIDTTPPAANPLNSLLASRTTATSSETVYSILADPKTGIVPIINNTHTGKTYFSPFSNNPAIYVADVVSNGTKATIAIGTQITGTGAASVQLGSATKGSKTVTITSTTLTATSIAAGNFIEIGGLLYSVATTPTVGSNIATITLDRPYTGETFSGVRLDNSTQGMKTVTAITEYGVKITTEDYFSTFRVALGLGGFANATLTYATSWSLGIGTPEETMEEEIEGTVFHSGSSTANAAFADDYGQPTKYAKANRAYATIKVSNILSERSTAAPVNEYSKAVTLIVKAAYGSTTFTIGGTAQSSGFSAISNPQLGLSAASASALVTTSNDGLAYVLGVANIN
jgi:hypothetical protein